MALRIALGLPKWTPNIVLMKIAGQEVLSEKIKRLAAQFFIRQLANGTQSPIYDQNCRPSIKLIKKDEVLMANLFADLDTSTDHIISFPDTLFSRNNVSEIHLSDFSFQNKDHPVFLIKDLFEEAVSKEFYDYHIIATVTYKSYSFTSIVGISSLQSFVYRIHPINFICTAEALAICQALDELSVTDKNLLLLTGSYSVLQALKCLTIRSPKDFTKIHVMALRNLSHKIAFLGRRFPIFQLAGQCALKVFKNNNSNSRLVLSPFLPAFLLLKAASSLQKSGNSKIIDEADNLYNDGKYEQLCLTLHPNHLSDDPEILWRLARAIFEKCRDVKEDKEKLVHLEEALHLVDKALEINEECWAAHKLPEQGSILYRKGFALEKTDRFSKPSSNNKSQRGPRAFREDAAISVAQARTER
ncbi:hypothetical protein AVEN_449-1 [Araneus ventricosus]|uniref:RNase H type-1 domain-containing protein n=1 Tax=Araneus ventricosus TaxID=182803 RepID=A0A4Y1ZQE5_ARAVE|nr:hypothetical protein AVEN_449-1 [Araneus ventricosus]